MNRVEFTSKITMLLFNMIQEGEHPVGESWWREDVEQHALWQKGRDADGNKIGPTVTEHDGFKSISNHQFGKALDIQFISDDGTKLLPGPKKGWTYWHDEWVKMGGGREISWDEDHFE